MKTAHLIAVIVAVVTVLGGVATFGSTGVAQTAIQGGTIQEIRIEGTQRIEPQTVQSYMRIDPGDPFDPELLDQALKNIFATGLFADVSLQREGNTLVVRVAENPIINRIAFEGNDRLDNEALSSEIELRPRVVFTRTKAQSDTQRILELYRRNGRFAATVEPKVIQLEQNRVDLVFEISEGPLTTIRSINFVGNEAYSDSTLRGEVTSSEYSFWNFLSTSDTYDPDRVSFDRELLRRFYLSEGYADFRVLSVVAELTPDRESFIITFTVEEGARYKFGEIGIETTLRDLDPETLRGELQAEEGDWYDAELVEEDVDLLSQAVSDLGFAFVDVRPRADRDREELIIDLTYEISEGPKVFVERIDIEGNVRTLDRVIRREFRLVEGDAFNASKLRRSRQRIENLGFFKSVTVDTEEGSLPDRSVIKVQVEEQSTGDLTFGAGFSTQSGPIGSVQLRERNLLGRGQDLRLGVSIAGSASELDLSFTEPYFLGRNLAAGFDAYRITNEQDESSFEETRLGTSLRAGFDLSENLREVTRYTLEQRELSDIEEDASEVVKAEQGETLRSSVSNEFIYDVRDSRFDPREGYVTRWRQEIAGLGGDARFFKTSIGAGYYHTFADEFTAAVRGETGIIIGLGEETRVADRFFRGGTSPRGFEFAGIGPRDAETDDSLGGKQFYTTTFELSFPLGLPEELDVRGRAFTDIASVWGVDDAGTGVEIDDSSKPRVSVGAGLSWNSPFGPVVVDLGFAVIKEDFDKTQLLSFSFGTQF